MKYLKEYINKIIKFAEAGLKSNLQDFPRFKSYVKYLVKRLS